MNWPQFWHNMFGSNARWMRLIATIAVIVVLALNGKPWLESALDYLDAHQPLRNFLGGVITLVTTGHVTTRAVRKIRARSP